MKLNKSYLLIRIIASPFALGLLVITYTKAMLIHWIDFIKYGGDFVSYQKNDRATVQSIYQELKKKNEFSEKLIEISKIRDETNPTPKS